MLEVYFFYVLIQLSWFSNQRSASRAAMHPVPAAVIAWR
jgi:hypothetical protein